MARRASENTCDFRLVFRVEMPLPIWRLIFRAWLRL
jgi:hypothetical protein